MNQTYKISDYYSDIRGIEMIGKKIVFHTVLRGKNSNGLLLFDKETKEVTRIDFDDSLRTGQVYQGVLSGVDYKKFHYMFHEDGVAVPDSDAKALTGHYYFGDAHKEAMAQDAVSECCFVADEFDWKCDQKPNTVYEDSIYYGMHVRGFTKDPSSRIKEAGTFAGVTKKITYLKKLGITGVVMQPIYETEECTDDRINYWGYLPGYYYAPKNSYAFSKDAVTECKTMIRELHKNSIEVILQFYFPAEMNVSEMEMILAYWSKHYHVDGFQLVGPAIPFKSLADSPYLADVKLWAEDFPYGDLQSLTLSDTFAGNGDNRIIRRLASYKNDYMCTIRRFLKGDGGLLSDFITQIRKNDCYHGDINYLSSYNGFRLFDVFSYDNKHNIENGENNQDGENYNCSWNCGVEGTTRKKTVLQLREKQFRNAWLILLSSQATPFFFMGDEWGKSAAGNNNPYCLDQDITWQKWNLKKQEKERLNYVTEMIAFRKAHNILRQKAPLRSMDYLSCGYPDLSYHGKEAWKPDFDFEDRQIGVFLCGAYEFDEKNKDKHMYLIYNMHWEEKKIAFPKIESGLDWKLVIDTARPEEQVFVSEEEPAYLEDHVISIPGRSIRVYVTQKSICEKVRKKAKNNE